MAAHRKTLKDRLLLAIGPTVVVAMGVTVVASAQSSSPFATQKKRQAWEQPQATQPAPAPVRTPAPHHAPPAVRRSSTPPAATTPDWSAYQPSASPQPRAPEGNTLPEGYSYQSPTHSLAGAPAARTDGYSATTLQPYEAAPAPQYANPSPYQFGAAQPQPGAQSGPFAGPGTRAPRRRGWLDRLGLRNLSTLFTGGVRGGVGARDSDGWEETFIGDADAEFEISAITDGGLEYGVNLQGRAQYDEGRRGFTRRLPDCPPTLAGCASVDVNGVPVALRGHTSQFYTSGPDVADDVQLALESAHLFLRSAYGDVTLGRDDGAAYLFSLGAPTVLNVGASNSPVDYTGLDAVKTVNDASGFAEKVTYTSPRLLGDTVGVGVQVGVSYAPDPYACGVDYCVDRSDITNVLTPDLEDVVEAGLSLDRTFANGLKVEGTATYARGSEVSDLAGFDDLQSIGAGVEVSLRDWTVGGSWLTSNQGLENGDYEAFDIGVSWKPSILGFSAGYGHATDDLVGLSADQFSAGVSYDLNERVTLGAGVQHADRESVRDIDGTAQLGGEKATAVFIEGGITF